MRRRTTQGSLTQLTRRLAAYVPTTLAARILDEGGVPPPGDVRCLPAAALFCDLSGFTSMTSELATDGPRGAEELSRILLMTFTVMINAIHTSRGAVVHFYGDAMLVYFPDDDEEAALRALSCARFMQNLMQRGYSEVVSSRQEGGSSSFNLAMKIGVGYGSAVEVVVGDEHGMMEFVLGGSAVTDAVSAQNRAAADQVIASRAVLERAGLPASGDFRLLTEVMPVPYAPPILYINSYDSQRLRVLVDAGARFMHPALPERIMGDRGSFVAEHRPVTSLFVQFEGIDFDAPDAGRLLQHYYEWAVSILARFGGENCRVNRVLTGDKGSQLHIIFGAPVAPDAPVQALRCALTLQREKPAFITSQRVGLAAGNVFAGAVGSGARREYTIIGETVNLSARLATFCPPGEIITDAATARRANEQFEFHELDPISLKGFVAPVALRRVVGERHAAMATGHRLDATQPLIRGRGAALQTLRNVLDAALDGFSSIVAIAGPVGAGRSRLLAAAVEHWRASGGSGYVGVAQVQSGDTPFSLWQPVWRDFFKLPAEMGMDQQAQRVVDTVRRLCPFGSGDVGLWVEALGLPVPQGAAAPKALMPDARQNRFFRLVRRTLEAAALQAPLLLAFEDLHYADPLSLALVDTVAAQWGDATLLLACTFGQRDGFAPAFLALPNCTVIPLQDLAADAGRRLAEELLNTDQLPPALIHHLGLDDEATRVNPAFIEESIQVLLESGILRRDDEVTLDEAALAAMSIPNSINSLLLARLDRVAPLGRTLLQAASVIGRQFDVRTLQYAVEATGTDPVAEALENLVQAQLIYQVSGAPEPAYLFRNDMTREVVYQSIPYARRQTLHAAVADGIRGDFADYLQPYFATLAHHYGQTDLHELSFRYALAAAREAQAIYASLSAIELYTMAERFMQAMDPRHRGEEAIALYLSRAEMRRLAGEDGAGADAEQALALAEEQGVPSLATRACNLLAELKCQSAPGGQVLALANRVVHELPRPIPPAELARAWVTRGEALAYLGEYDQGRISLEMAVALYADIDDAAGLLRAHVTRAAAIGVALGEWSAARSDLRAAQRLLQAGTSVLPDLEVRLALGLVDLALADREFRPLEQHLEAAAAIIEEKRVVWWRPAYLYRLARLHLAREVRAEAHATLHLARMAVQNGGNPDELAPILLALAQLTGRSEQADNYLRACVNACSTRARHSDRIHCLQQVRARGYAL